MASASTTLRISITIRCSRNDPLLLSQPRTRINAFPLHSSSSSSRPSSSVLTFSRRKSNSANSAITSSKKKKKSAPKKDAEEEGDMDEDAFEALFQLLEEDLKNDGLSLDDDDDISEEDLAKLELELEEALKDDELFGEIDVIGNEKVESEAEDEEVVAEDQNEDDEDEEMPVKLKNWQLRRLAYALRNGRRKTSIKNLAAELCLDRAVVLELLRDPPPNLVLLSATLPDEPVTRILEPQTKPQETVPEISAVPEISDVAEAEVKLDLPVHEMQKNWSAKKRLKKVQLETLELVYKRSKRPTNAMISSIVHVTNLPKKRVLKWFEDRRAEEGVPDRRVAYQP